MSKIVNLNSWKITQGLIKRIEKQSKGDFLKRIEGLSKESELLEAEIDALLYFLKKKP